MKVIQKFQIDRTGVRLWQPGSVWRLNGLLLGWTPKGEGTGKKESQLTLSSFTARNSASFVQLSWSCLRPSPWKPHTRVYISKGWYDYYLIVIRCLPQAKSQVERLLPPTALKAGPIVVALPQPEDLSLDKWGNLPRAHRLQSWGSSPDSLILREHWMSNGMALK